MLNFPGSSISRLKIKTNPTFLLVIFLAYLSSFSFAASTTTGTSQKLTAALCSIYTDLNSVIPTVAFVLFVLSGLAYAGGQFFGAEMRAKSTSWAMSMVTGAVIGLLIVQFASLIITNLVQQDLSAICPMS